MVSQVYYIIRSRADGTYLVARPKSTDNPDRPLPPGFLLLFREDYDALSYLNTHAGEMRDRFAVESVPATQIEGLLNRWNFDGIGFVEDPLLPRVSFLKQDRWE